MKTLIAIPSMDTVAVQFAQSLACLQKTGEVSVQFNVGSLIYESRNKLAQDAIKGGFDRVLWFDSDMAFPADTLVRLGQHLDNGADIVSGLYFRRTAPYTPVLFSKLDMDAEARCTWAGYDDYPEELFEIAGCGFGCVLMNTEVLVDVFAHFGTAFAPIGNTGEDVAFCVRARALGHKIVCDPTVKLGHAGHIMVTDEFFRAYKK